MGTELVDWMMQQSPCVHSRSQAVGMWQVLLEEGVLNHGKFKKKIRALTKTWAMCPIIASVDLFLGKKNKGLMSPKEKLQISIFISASATCRQSN